MENVIARDAIALYGVLFLLSIQTFPRRAFCDEPYLIVHGLQAVTHTYLSASAIHDPHIVGMARYTA